MLLGREHNGDVSDFRVMNFLWVTVAAARRRPVSDRRCCSAGRILAEPNVLVVVLQYKESKCQK